MKPFLVCDFDGTACLEDVGDRFFEHFTPPAHRAEWVRLNRDYEDGRIGSSECLGRQCEIVAVTQEAAHAFADSFRIEDSFARLWHWARGRGIGMAVVSDGLDVYIRRILDTAGLADVPVRSNRAHFEDGRIRPEFPWAGRGCGRCANCKGAQVREFQAEWGPVVMVGDGRSDVCGALAADRVFARAPLGTILSGRGVPFEPYDDFDQILSTLELDGIVPA